MNEKRNFDYEHQVDNSPMLMPDVNVIITYADDDMGSFDEAGYYHRCITRYNRRSWKFKYAILTEDEFAYLRHIFKGKSDFLFSFRDEMHRAETVRAYCKPVSVTYQSQRSGLYKNLTLEIIEC